MRPVDCEACHQPQPRDWQPGQRCIHCGGAVRTETRCAACTHWTPAAKFCRQCAAELVPDEWYGAARMLVAAGVDGLSLAARVRALEPEQRETFAARFAVQRAAVEALVQEARFAERFLLTKGHADRLEEELVSQLPWGRGRAEELRPETAGVLEGPGDLARLRERALLHETRALAALALARLGEPGRPELDDVRARLSAADPLGVEALVASARAEVAFGAECFTRWNLDEVEKLLSRARQVLPDGAERAVVEVAVRRLRQRDWTRTEGSAALEARLREGLASSDPGLRASCALLLGDEDTLAALLDEPAFRSRALRALSSRGSPHLVQRLRDAGDDESRRELLRHLKTPLDAAGFLAVTAVATATPGDVQREALRVLQRTKWSEVDASTRGPLAAWVGRQGLPVPLALDLLHWAVATGDPAQPYRTQAEVQPWAVAAARALALAPRTGETLRAQHLDAFFAVAGDGRPLEVVVAWLEEEATRVEALRHLFHLVSLLASRSAPADERGVAHFFAAWERLGDAGRARLAGPFSELFRREVGAPARERFLRGFWERFLAHPSERAAIWQATRSARRELDALRDGDPRAEALDGGDPARRFALYGPLDPLGAPELLSALCDRHGAAAALAGLTPAVLQVADALFETGEHRHALWLVASWMSEVVNRFRDESSREPWREAALGLEAAWQHACARRAATRPRDPTDSLRTFEEQVATELRLAREVTEREAAARERERQRAAEAAERERQRAAEAEARAAEQARQAEEAQQAAEARATEARRQLVEARQAVSVQAATLADSGDVSPLDAEVLVPDQPISTLRDYAALLRAMRGGADVLALFEQYGLSPTTWAACSMAWSTVMTRRMDVAMRFAKLLG